ASPVGGDGVVRDARSRGRLRRGGSRGDAGAWTTAAGRDAGIPVPCTGDPCRGGVRRSRRARAGRASWGAGAGDDRRGAAGGARRGGARALAGGIPLVAFMLLALLLWTVVYPNAAVIVGSFERGLADWRAFAASPADLDALRGTVVVSVGSVVAALLVGVPLA